jgi:hypothetical protein
MNYLPQPMKMPMMKQTAPAQDMPNFLPQQSSGFAPQMPPAPGPHVGDPGQTPPFVPQQRPPLILPQRGSFMNSPAPQIPIAPPPAGANMADRFQELSRIQAGDFTIDPTDKYQVQYRRTF